MKIVLLTIAVLSLEIAQSHKRSWAKYNGVGKKEKGKEREICKFGRGRDPYPRSFDVLKTNDCSCNNFAVQYKLAQIATDYNFNVGVISANRNADDLREKGIKKFIEFSENFIDDNQFYSTALFEDANIGGGGQVWNTLNEFLFDGNQNTNFQSIVDLLLAQDTTLIYTNPNWIITDCVTKYDKKSGEKIEITTLKSLFTLYRRPDDVSESDVLQRQFETLKFIKREKDNVYLIKSQIFEGTRFSIDNAKRRSDTEFSTFQH